MANLKKNIYSDRDERGYRLRLYLEETSFDSSTNTSQVDYKYYIEKNSDYSFATSNNKLSLSIDGTKILDNTSKSIDMTSSNSVLLKSGNRPIEHEEDGTKVLEVSASFTPSSSAYYMPFKKSLSGTFTLTDLDRSSTIESIEPFTTIIIDDENEFVEGITFTTNINDDNYTHKLAYSFDLYGQNYNGYITENATPIVGDFHNLIEVSFDEGYYNDNFQVGEALFMFPYDKFALTNMLIASKPMLTPIIDITFTLETYENGEYMGSDSKVYSYNLMPLYYKPIISNLTLQREEATSTSVEINANGSYYNLYPKIPLINQIKIARYKYKIDGQDESEWINVLGVESWKVEGNNWSYTTNIEVPTDKGASIVFYLEDVTGNVATSTNNVEKGKSMFDLGEQYFSWNGELCINDDEVPCFQEDSVEDDGSRNVTLYDSQGNKLNVAPSVEGGIVKITLPVDLANLSTSYNYFHPFNHSDNDVLSEGNKLTYEKKIVDYGDRIGATVYGVTVGEDVSYVRVTSNVRVLNNSTSKLAFTTDIGRIRDGELTTFGGTSDTLQPEARHTSSVVVTQIPVQEGDFLFIYAYKGSKTADVDVISAWEMTNVTFEVTHINGLTIINNNGGGSGSGTTDYEELDNLPRINGVKVIGNKSLQEYGITIPTNVSSLNNDVGYLTSIPSEYVTETELNNKGYLTSFTETDPTVPSHVKNITSANITSWNNKSDFSGSYNDLTNKPTIPTVPTQVSAFTNDVGYLTSIPSEYITETELASKKYLTNIPSEYVTDSELNAKGYLTEHQPIKTVNGQTLIGSGDITIEGGSSVTELTSNFNVWDLESGIYYVAPNVTMTNYTMFYDSLTSLGVTADTSMPSITIQLAKAFLIVHNYNEGMGMVEFNLFMMGEVPTVLSGATMYQEGIAMGGTIIGGDFMLSNKLQNYQEKLVSGTNIKTINGETLLGNGDITIEGGGGGIETLSGSVTLANLEAGFYSLAPDTNVYYYGQSTTSYFTLNNGGQLAISDGNNSYKAFEIVATTGSTVYLYLGGVSTMSNYGFYSQLSRLDLANARGCTNSNSQKALGYRYDHTATSNLNSSMYFSTNEWSLLVSAGSDVPSDITSQTKVHLSTKMPGYDGSGYSATQTPFIRQDLYAPSLNKHWYRTINYTGSSTTIYPEWTEIVENASNGGSGSGSANVTPITTISSASTHSEIPSAKAVYDLFNSIINGDEVSY